MKIIHNDSKTINLVCCNDYIIMRSGCISVSNFFLNDNIIFDERASYELKNKINSILLQVVLT